MMIVLIMLGVVSMIAASVAIRSQRSMQSSHQQSQQMAADDAAYSGLQVGLAQIESVGETWGGISSLTTLPQMPALGYKVFVNSNYSNTSPIEDPDGTEIPPKSIYVKSIGYYEGVATAGASAIVAQDEGVSFNYPAFATQTLNFANSAVSAVDASGVLTSGNAPIRTNGDTAGAITLTNTFVDGDVTVGPLGDPAVALVADGTSGFSGTAGVAGTDLPLPSVVASYDDSAPTNIGSPIPIPLPGLGGLIGFLVPIRFSAPAPGTYSSIGVDTATMGTGGLPGLIIPIPSLNILILSDGDYYTSDFSTGDSVAIVLSSANTRMHVRDNVDFAAAVTTVSGPSGSAHGLQLHQTSPSGGVNFTNVAGSTVVTSEGAISVDSSVVQGALYGSHVNVNNSQLIYPEALDGEALSANVSGGWNLFGQRKLKPSEVAGY